MGNKQFACGKSHLYDTRDSFDASDMSTHAPYGYGSNQGLDSETLSIQLGLTVAATYQCDKKTRRSALSQLRRQYCQDLQREMGSLQSIQLICSAMHDLEPLASAGRSEALAETFAELSAL